MKVKYIKLEKYAKIIRDFGLIKRFKKLKNVKSDIEFKDLTNLEKREVLVLMAEKTPGFIIMEDWIDSDIKDSIQYNPELTDEENWLQTETSKLDEYYTIFKNYVEKKREEDKVEKKIILFLVVVVVVFITIGIIATN